MPVSTQAVFYYTVPDDSVPAEDRAFYSFPVPLEIRKETQPLHDWRTAGDDEIVKGNAGLDVQGFTYIEHTSALRVGDNDDDDWFTGRKVEEVYIPEVEKLICEITGASKAVVDGISIRAKPSSQQNGVGGESDSALKVELKGSNLDIAVGKIPRDIARVTGRDNANLIAPARYPHIDYNSKGLRDTARYGRKDIAAVAADALAAEDAVARGENTRVPRYAVYSVWRPLETVKRDPLAVLDWRTTDPTEVIDIAARALSGVNESGEYLRTGCQVKPPKHPQQQKWYFKSEQRPDEPLIIKFADTTADQNAGVAPGCVHCSPAVLGVDDMPTRKSIEARVLAFWD